jgi:type I restriction enzyme R subunit
MSQPELIQSENPAIELFQKMGYRYINGVNLQERENITQTILEKRLREAIERLNPWMDDTHIQKAFAHITEINGASLMEINQKIWEVIKGGSTSFNLPVEIDGVEEFREVKYIDYQNAENNDFLVVNQMRFHGKSHNCVPDIMIYLNGMPVAVIECKAPTAMNAWDKAFEDLKYYQENSEKLFHFNVLCCGVWKDGGRYGAINALQKFYSVYRTNQEDDISFLGDEPSAQDIMLYSIFERERLLDIIRHFVIFELDEGKVIKKLPRYQQLRATNKTIAKLQTGHGGVVWHTQGSGKSITMAYVTRKLQAKEFGFDNPTVLVMTDRKDLDRQITTTLRNVGFKGVNQASSVEHLDKLLRNDYGGIITTTLQKFQSNDAVQDDTCDQTELEEHGDDTRIEKHIHDKTLTLITKKREGYRWVEVERLEIELEELSKKENLYVLVDEAHRSHYGFLASFMRTTLPNAKFVAFTGTPISKEDKSTLGEFYGGDYIDIYTIKESVADGATVALLYDEGIEKLVIKKDELDKEFDLKFGHYKEEKKDKLKREALRKYQLSTDRMTKIAEHIIDHYQNKIFPDGHKAMLVCSGREAAIKYQKILSELKDQGIHDFNSKVVVSLGSPKTDAIAKEYYETIEWNKKNPKDQKPVWVVAPEDVKTATDDFKLKFGDESETDLSGKKQHDNTAIIIVSDMLLTGWDAPIASCLYLDKPLKEHNLLQAIARVNRSREGKNAGFIMDYCGITSDLIHALEIFSGDIRPDDILKNLNEEIPKLEAHHAKLVSFFAPMRIDRNYERERYIDRALQYIEPIDMRDEFKSLLKQFNKAINIVLPNTAAIQFFDDFKLYNEIKLRARNAFPDDEELKISKDESKMLQDMIDEHLHSNGVENLLEEPVSIIDKDKFKEEILNASPATKELKMRNNLKHTIKVGLDRNPDFYKPLAQRLEELLKLKEAKRIDETQLLLEYAKIQDKAISEQKEGEEKGFTTIREVAVYNSMKAIFNGDAEDATRIVFDLIQGELSIVNWKNNNQVRKDMQNKIKRFLQTKIDRETAKNKATELVNIIDKNTNA